MAKLTDQSYLYLMLDLIHSIPESKIREVTIEQQADMYEGPYEGGETMKKWTVKGGWITIRMYVSA